MQLRVALFILVSVLTTCEATNGTVAAAPVVVPATVATVQPAVPTPSPSGYYDGEQSDVGWSPWWGRTDEGQNLNQKCADPPPMPRTFFAKRKWASFLNRVIFYDRFGKEFAHVETHFLDWKNPFGYPGASFFLKALPTEARQGLYRLNPQKGEDGWAAPTPAPGVAAAGPAEEANSTAWDMHQQWVRKHGSASYDVETENAFLHKTYGQSQNRLVASIHTKPSDKNNFFETALSENMLITDCKGHHKFEVYGEDDHGTIGRHNAGKNDAQYYTKRRNTENSVIISDFSSPTVELVRLHMSNPCSPFPPFCQQMGIWNWFIYNLKWGGEIVQPGYNETVGNGFIFVQMTDGAATDMRFLALYSSYQFSNTRWSPLMFIVMWTLFLIGICCCCRCCCNCCRGAEKKVEEEKEEAEKLMETVEGELKGEEKKSSIFDCCSRKGRTIYPGMPTNDLRD